MNEEIIPPPQNLKDWSSGRLKLLLAEYSEALPGMRALYGRNHPETVTFQIWVKALEEEIAGRLP